MKDVCIGCYYRSDEDIATELKYGKGYNPSHFCKIGYKQNPKSSGAILNTLQAGGEVCRRIVQAYILSKWQAVPSANAEVLSDARESRKE